MKISSSAFQDGAPIPSKYSCDGQRINPPLEFSGVPENTQSLVLIMDDIDVPRSNRPDGIWNHWLLCNIPPDTRLIAENEAPGTSLQTTGGEREYQGPCPPSGEHRYVFRLFALREPLDIDPNTARRDDVLRAMEGKIIARAELTGTFRRARTGAAG